MIVQKLQDERLLSLMIQRRIFPLVQMKITYQNVKAASIGPGISHIGLR